MNKKCFIVLYLVGILFSSCYPRIGGNRGGPSYSLVSSQNIYFDFKLMSVCCTDTPKKDISLSFYHGNTLLSYGGLGKKGSFNLSYKLPDSLISFSQSNNLDILIIIDYERYYDLNIIPSDWKKEERKFGYRRQY